MSFVKSFSTVGIRAQSMNTSPLAMLTGYQTFKNVASRTLVPAQSLLVRHYSSPQDRFNMRVIIRDYGVLDDFVPLKRQDRPSLLSKKGWKVSMAHWKNTVLSTLGVGMVKFHVKGFKPKQFVQDAEELYNEMNTAFASGNLDVLKEVCTETMFAKLKAQMKGRSGTYKWFTKGEVEKPRLVTLRFGRLADKMILAQATVRIHSKQGMVVQNKKGQIIGGDRKKTQDILEYIVLQRMISQPGTKWQIYCKVHEKPM
ncbi:Tim44-domain-containing protein [Basidiobolus meristosporus CBS 931.73]|uniref:Large ribosomal subunit protein mL45 n=1 Tax=Basidiobolus meristosporus CBS 931.73 TaxID=1314790 RepID=A0A1Y1ZDF3_9FUNG|nr:Tim44-domain-containing protein [Basidiobolus meristosporus CBS 931.73]|eukprot:ORY08320.1 Tim44-domain-containing protein [Basidiobolus meristosporus CBS 931.73]